jgi:hypothetical protein
MTPITLTGQYAVRRDPYTPVRIICVDGPGDYPVVGFVGKDLMQWYATGAYTNSRDGSDLDLIPLATHPVAPLRCWANVGGTYGPGFYETEREARQTAMPARTRIAVPMIEEAAAQGLVDALQTIKDGSDGWAANFARAALSAWESRQ